jgi:diguanylate cyclase (GGDEF)-like protein
MAKLSTFRKENLILGALIVFSIAFLGIFLLIHIPLYFKLLFVPLLAFLVVMWAFLFLSKKRSYRLLVEAQKQQNDKLQELSELAFELSRIPFVPDKLPEITPKLTSFFEEYFKSNEFLLFVSYGCWGKKGKMYQPLVGSNVTLPPPGKMSIKFNHEFLSLLKSKEGINDLSGGEFTKSGKAPSSFRSLQKEYQFDSIIPLSTESDLWGFITFKRESKSLGPPEKSALHVLKQIALNLERQSFTYKLNEFEKKYDADSKQLKGDLSVLTRDLKRKIFDLGAVSSLVKSLYSVQEEEGLFSSLARMIQEHLAAKSVLVMLPQKENHDVVGRHFSGVDGSSLFGKEGITELRIQKGTPLYNWIKNEKLIWYLYAMQKLSHEEKLLDKLLGSGFQIGAKLPFTRDSFGVIFLGEKTDGVKYRQIDLDILAILVNMAVITYKNIIHYKSIEELSYTDSMTELYNYRYFYKRLTEEVLRAKRFGRKLALVILDIDDFKIYNDNYGHQAGDQLLRQLGRLLARTVRSIDVVSRYGGEEFCVIMPESDQEECFKFMERLRKSIMNFPFKSEVVHLDSTQESGGEEYIKREHNITVSLGGAIYPHDAQSVDRLIYCADMALLRAKGNAKNRSVIYEEQLAAVKESTLS